METQTETVITIKNGGTKFYVKESADEVLDLLDDYIELKEQIEERNNIQKYKRTKEGKLICI